LKYTDALIVAPHFMDGNDISYYENYIARLE